MRKRPKWVWSKPSRRVRQKSAVSSTTIKVLGGAALVGALGGAAPSVFTAEKLETVQEAASLFSGGRERAPLEGDYWRSCGHARSPGTAPIYSQEPGYRPELDRDNDGVACEPYRGR